MDSPHAPLQQEQQQLLQQQQQQQQEQEHRSIRPQPSSLSTSSIGSAATFVASPLSSFNRGGASFYQPITAEDYMASHKGARAEKQQQKDQQQSPSPSLQQQQKEFSSVSPSSMGSGTFAGCRPQGLGVRYNNSGVAKMVRHGPPPVSKGGVISGSPDGGGEAGGLFRGLESHLEEEEDREREDDSIGHKRATSIGTLDYEYEDYACKSDRLVERKKNNWLSMTVIILAIYSAAGSALWLSVAVAKPRWGRKITATSGSLTPASASLTCAALAKSIELSFVTVFVAFLGQVLSRRAFAKRSRGVTIAEMNMRSWVMQPGTLLTHFKSVQYAGFTILGALTLLATFTAMLYTTASDALGATRPNRADFLSRLGIVNAANTFILVAPKLKLGRIEHRNLQSKVFTRFANSAYIKDHCISIPKDQTSADFCLGTLHASQALPNYMQYLAQWSRVNEEGELSSFTNLTARPNAIGMLYGNTNVEGSWINVRDMAVDSKKFGRIINDVTMAMPHAGVSAAARDPSNNIIQPKELNGLGEYFIRASVPSPAVNVLCATATEAEIAPMIYERWPGYVKLEPWPQLNIPTVPSWLNKTALDDVFGFGEKYNRRAPVFSKFPKPYNAVFNETINCTECDSVYVLVAPAQNTSYTLCSLRAFLTPSCSTEYRATMIGGTIKSHCDDPTDNLAYHHNTNSSAPDRVLDHNWPPVAGFWGYALALDAGRADANAAANHVLAQLIPESPTLDARHPSIAEALAVLAGNTLLLSTVDSPFVHYWNQSRPSLASPRTEYFKATIRSQDYASGGTQRWQNVFYLVLGSTFVLSFFCLFWFFLRNGYLTDFIEPQNLFALSVNSPPSHALKGSCGGGPEREQLMTRWFINIDPDREHYYIQEGEHQPVRKGTKKNKQKREFELSESSTVNTYHRLAMRRNSIL